MKIEPRKILEGIKNTVFMQEAVETIAAERIAICRACPFDSINIDNKGWEKCTLCGCNLKWKTRSLSSSCPSTPPRWEAISGLSDDQSNEIDKITGNE